MRKIIEVEHDCNRCERNGCRGDVIRDRRGGIKQWLSCPGHMEPRPMRCTLLERASENPGSFIALGKVLQTMGLQFDEIPRYPYFRFIVAESEQEVKEALI
jgi:hypothetical protein